MVPLIIEQLLKICNEAENLLHKNPYQIPIVGHGFKFGVILHQLLIMESNILTLNSYK